MIIKYLYIERTPHGTRVRRDIPGTCSKEGLQYIGRGPKAAEKQFRQDFDCKGQHFHRVYI